MAYTETSADLEKQITDTIRRRDEWREAGDMGRADSCQADLDLYRSLRTTQPKPGPR